MKHYQRKWLTKLATFLHESPKEVAAIERFLEWKQ